MSGYGLRTGAGFGGRLARGLIARSGVVRAFVKAPAAQRFIQTWRRRTAVETPGRFVLRELTRGPSVATYRLRGSKLAVALRHRTRDVEIFDEIFVGPSVYEPPPGANRVLDGCPAPRVIDFGGNIGLFGVFAMSRFPGARLTSFEPDPANAAVLRRAVTANRADHRWQVVEACVGNADGSVSFSAGAFADSKVIDDGIGAESAAITVPCLDVFRIVTGADFVKMDIEGSEWSVLCDPRLAELDARVVALEWHDEGSGSDDPRGEAQQAFESAGYAVLADDAHGYDHGMLWAWRPVAQADT